MLLNKISLGIVILSWIVFGIGFLSRKKQPSQGERIKDWKAYIGLALEAIGFSLVFSVQRESLTDFVPSNLFIKILLTILICCIAITSVWLTTAAFRKLGKQWNPSARIIEGHDLVISGPYGLVRHPIYSGMFGLMIITGYVITKPWSLALAVVLYFTGTIFRIKIEERLLIQHFGEQYENYKSKVSALIPFLF